MKQLFTILAMFFSIVAFSQVKPLKYVPMYTPMSESEMEVIAFNRAVKAAENKANYNYYKDLAIKNAKKDDYESCIYYAKAAYKFKYVSADLFYYEGVSYFKLKKKRKYKRVIRKAKKQKYFEVVKLLKELDK